MPDASAVMQLLLKTQTDFNDLEDDDPQVGSRRDTQWFHSSLEKTIFSYSSAKPILCVLKCIFVCVCVRSPT